MYKCGKNFLPYKAMVSVKAMKYFNTNLHTMFLNAKINILTAKASILFSTNIKIHVMEPKYVTIKS